MFNTCLFISRLECVALIHVKLNAPWISSKVAYRRMELYFNVATLEATVLLTMVRALYCTNLILASYCHSDILCYHAITYSVVH